jgi:quercetin dioxygenase-like cupin family protein
VNVLEKKPEAKGSPERFTGDVWTNMLVEGAGPSCLRVGLVRFAPGARTAWHRHSNGQTLHITDGIGLAQSRGGDAIVMRTGDTIYTPPNEWHWHGATAEHFMAHLAVSETSDDPATVDVEWGEHVADDDYQKASQVASSGGDSQ